MHCTVETGAQQGLCGKMTTVMAQTLPMTTTLLFHLLTPGLGQRPHHTSDPILDPRPILEMSAPMSVPLGIWTSGHCWIRTLDIQSSSGSHPQIPTGSPVTLVSMITAVPSLSSLAVIHHLPSPQFMSPCLQTAYRIPTAHVSRPLGSRTHLLMDFLPSPFLSFCILLLSDSLWSFACSIARSCPCM
jgi:hypothetical protein